METRAKDRKGKVVVGYARVSTARQDAERQKAAIYEYANARGWQVDRVIQTTVSSRKAEEARGIDTLRDLVTKGPVDVLLFAELSRLARSVGQIVRLVDEFVEAGTELHFIKEGLILNNGKRDMAAKVTLTLFSLMAEIERDLISERTKDGLACRKAEGVKLGRPAGKSKLDRHENEIREKVEMGVTQRAVAREFGCSAPTLIRWLKRKRKEWRKQSK